VDRAASRGREVVASVRIDSQPMTDATLTPPMPADALPVSPARTTPLSALPQQAPQIVLTWIARLRWLAVAGQVMAVAIATWPLGMNPPLVPIATLIGVTILSNLLLHRRLARAAVRPWAVPAVLLLDVALLTGLLYLTGGANNPFATLYLVHVAMAVAVLQSMWTWLIIAITALSYAMLMWWHLPLSRGREVSQQVLIAGEWASVLIVAVLIAYFSGRITRALRQRERELASIRDRAARNEQLAALTTLAAGAAHELGTPLGTIAIIAKELELEARRAGTDPHIAEDAQLIRQEVDRCRVILERMRVDILEDQPHGRTVQVDELAECIRGDLTPQQASRLNLTIDPAARGVRLPLRAIQQAVGVMLRNAYDAGDDSAPVALRIERDRGHIIFRVTDKGRGMSQEILRRAGEPFFTTKPPGRGMGLGLFLVRLVAEKYGGRLELRSQPGAGTTAELSLPDSISPLPGDAAA